MFPVAIRIIGPRCLLNDADAKRACISLYITSCCSYRSTTHLSFQFSSSQPFRLCSPPPTPLLCSAAFLIEGSMLSPFSLVCFCQRDTCCRIAEFSCLLNLLTTLNYFIPALSHHIFTQPHCISIHSHHSPSFPSSWVSVSLPTQCVPARTRLQGRQESFTVQLFQYIQALSHSMATLSLLTHSPRIPPPFRCHSLL